MVIVAMMILNNVTVTCQKLGFGAVTKNCGFVVVKKQRLERRNKKAF